MFRCFSKNAKYKTIYLYIIYADQSEGHCIYLILEEGTEPRCRGGAEGQREEGEGGEKMNHLC